MIDLYLTKTNYCRNNIQEFQLRFFTLLCFSFRVYLLNKKFRAFSHIPTGWTHIVLNYIGPNDGEGIWIYYNGAEVVNGTTKSDGTYSAGDGRIVVGRCYIDEDRRYASMEIDELIFFNKALTTTDIEHLYNTV